MDGVRLRPDLVRLEGGCSVRRKPGFKESILETSQLAGAGQALHGSGQVPYPKSRP